MYDDDRVMANVTMIDAHDDDDHNRDYDDDDDVDVDDDDVDCDDVIHFDHNVLMMLLMMYDARDDERILTR